MMIPKTQVWSRVHYRGARLSIVQTNRAIVSRAELLSWESSVGCLATRHPTHFFFLSRNQEEFLILSKRKGGLRYCSNAAVRANLKELPVLSKLKILGAAVAAMVFQSDISRAFEGSLTKK